MPMYRKLEWMGNADYMAMKFGLRARPEEIEIPPYA